LKVCFSIDLHLHNAIHILPGIFAPAWFVHAMNNALAPLLQEIQDLRQEVRDLRIQTLKAMNKSASNPLDSLVEVVNAAGAAPPHNAFPETLQLMVGLSVENCNALITHYGLTNNGSIAVKRRRVGVHIGIRAHHFA
jgi:hypothetical protein